MLHRLEKTIDPNLPYFAGHFPGNPVVPGFVTVQSSIEIIRSIGVQWEQVRIDSAKFLRPMTPGLAVVIEVEADTERAVVRWSTAGDHSELALFVFVRG